MSENAPPPRFPVVALGGSAGGLEAFFEFFEAYESMPDPPACAVVVVLHLSPDAESHLPTLLAARTRLAVDVVDAPRTIEVGRVYVLPPGATLSVADGALIPVERAPGAAHHPLDDLFSGLAAEFGERLVAIVCSGTGSNGSAALGAVREAGGYVIAQSPETAAFDTMPSRAIATGLVDVVAAPRAMVEPIVAVARRLAESAGAEAGAGAAPDVVPRQSGADEWQQGLAQIIELTRARSSIDFGLYKQGTVGRRIERRMRLLELPSSAAYATLLAARPDEVERLVDDLLITVTTFFRDEEPWRVLGDRVLDPLLANRAPDDPVRVWVAGCATGEEAYSVAIALLDRLERLGRRIQVEIFATDVSKQALARARRGEYPAAAVDRLPAPIAERWFQVSGDVARVDDELREAVLFARHNLLQDPPFSRADLVVCRNVLIYLKPNVQRRLLRLFHFSPKENGCLFLGTAEGIADAGEMFEAIDPAARIYRRIGPALLEPFDFPLAPFRRARSALGEGDGFVVAPRMPQRALDSALRALVDRHAPPSVAIDGNGDVIYYQGATERYLRQRSGAATHDLMSLCHPSLTAHLRRLVERARVAGEPVRARVRVRLEGGPVSLAIEAAPAKADDGEVLLVSFLEEAPAPPVLEPEATATTREADLEDEIRLLREELATTVWAARRAGEDLKAYNEEMTSMNEELRAANEELETSKEELQSLNEELRAVNTQLRVKVTELHERTADLDNLLTSTDNATLFLGPDLEIRWYSPAIARLFHVRETDLGRPLPDLVRRFSDEALEDDCRRVARDFAPREAQVESAEGRVLIRRVLPYRIPDGRVAGVVVTFSDVTEIQTARRYAERIVQSVPVPILVLDEACRVTWTNEAFEQTFEVAETEVVGRLFEDVGGGLLDQPSLRHRLRDVLPDNGAFTDCELSIDVAGRAKTILASGRRLDHVQQILLVLEDVTARRAWQSQQSLLIAELRHRVKNSLAVVLGLASSTARRCVDLAEFQSVFAGRLKAYASGHDALFRNDWGPSDLGDLATTVVRAHAVDPARVDIAGPAVAVSATQALALSLILHELETNAVKHGALSMEGGTVSIRWALDAAGMLSLTWGETGGPATRPPERDGFGTALVRQLVRHDLQGELATRFEPDGLAVTLAFPVGEPRPVGA